MKQRTYTLGNKPIVILLPDDQKLTLEKHRWTSRDAYTTEVKVTLEDHNDMIIDSWSIPVIDGDEVEMALDGV